MVKSCSKMKFNFHVTGLFKEVCFTLIALTIYMFCGIGRTYMVFLFRQLDIAGSQIVLNDEQKSWIGSSVGLLSPVGCVLSGALMDFFGRKLYFFIMFIPLVISWIIIALANSYEILLIGMIIQGFGLGMGFCTSTYISEISSSSRRGALLGLITISYNFGGLLSNSFMYFTTWTNSAWIFTLLSFFCMLCTLLLPESPAWLYSKGKKEASIRALCSIRCSNAIDVKTEIDDMEKWNAQKSKTSLIRILTKVLKAWKPFLIVAVLQCTLGHSGYNFMFSYTIFTFDRLRLPIDSSKFAIGYPIPGLIGAIVAPYVMHRMKRRRLLAISSFIMGACMTTVAVYEEIFYNRDDKPFSHIVPALLYVFSFACNAGVFLIAYSVGSEVFPNEVRGFMNGLYGVVTYVHWFVTFKFYPTLMNVFHIKVILWFFVGNIFVITLYAVLILPETKGMTLNEVQEKYFKKKSKKSTEEE